jgi:hypothetical protein
VNGTRLTSKTRSRHKLIELLIPTSHEKRKEGIVTRLKYLRACEDVQEDLIMPFLGLGLQPGTEVRMTVVMEVLRRLTKKDYGALKRKADDAEFQWFIPIYKCLGGVFPFPANVFKEKEKAPVGLELNPYAKVIFLSPRLEEIDFDIAVAVVAHELAHILLGHKIRPDSETDEIQEKSAWNKVIEWGFTKEEKKHRSLILEAMKNDKKELAMLEKKQKEAEAKKRGI